MTLIINVISLERSVRRREVFSQLNGHIEFEYFNAVDGSAITRQMIESSKLFQDSLPYSSGAYGCALSHLALWDKAINEDCVVTVAEDDAVFRFDFVAQSSRIIHEMPSDWDIILWGWNFDSILSISVMPGVSPVVAVFNQDQFRVSVDNFQNLEQNACTFRLDKCLGMPAYSISPVGASKFKSLCFPLANFNLYFPLLNRSLPNKGIDIAMNRVYKTTNSYCSFPPLVITKNEHSHSTIHGSPPLEIQ